MESEVEENDEGSRRSARPRALNIEYEESLSGSSRELSSFSKPAAKDKMKANFPPPPVIFTNRSNESSLALTNPGFVLAPGSGTLSRLDDHNKSNESRCSGKLSVTLRICGLMLLKK